MTDRTISLLVTLDQEYRVDDAEAIANAIKMIKGVLDVSTKTFSCADTMNAYSARVLLKKSIFERMYELFGE